MGFLVTYEFNDEFKIHGYFDSYEDAKKAVLSLLALGFKGIKARERSYTNNFKEVA